jgi:plasmid maintenance system antidote protein VapI
MVIFVYNSAIMQEEISILKGIHPGIILARKLKERNLAKGPFALSINEYPQTLGAITKGKRSMNTALALKIERALGLEEGYLMMLQVFYEIKEEKRRQHENFRPDLSRIRPGLFWDTNITRVDWQAQRRAVIERILERGNDEEKVEIKRFYGESIVAEIADKIKDQHA